MFILDLILGGIEPSYIVSSFVVDLDVHSNQEREKESAKNTHISKLSSLPDFTVKFRHVHMTRFKAMHKCDASKANGEKNSSSSECMIFVKLDSEK